jgi:hypothetical protein
VVIAGLTPHRPDFFLSARAVLDLPRDFAQENCETEKRLQ